MPDLIRAGQDGLLVVFAGAGVSTLPPSSLPTCTNVNRILVNSLAEQSVTLIGRNMANEAADLILRRHERDKLPPEYQAEMLVEVLGPAYFEVLRHLDSCRPNEAHLIIAALAKLGCVRAVITTNFDQLFETAFQVAGTPFDCQVPGISSITVATPPEPGGLASTRCLLLKLHGSANRAQTLIDTLAQRKRGFPPAVVESIRQLLHVGPWLFLGYSGRDFEAVEN
jgi:hypothetical protein